MSRCLHTSPLSTGIEMRVDHQRGCLEKLEVALLNSRSQISPSVQPFVESVAKINVFKAKQGFAISIKLARIISRLGV